MLQIVELFKDLFVICLSHCQVNHSSTNPNIGTGYGWLMIGPKAIRPTLVIFHMDMLGVTEAKCGNNIYIWYLTTFYSVLEDICEKF